MTSKIRALTKLASSRKRSTWRRILQKSQTLTVDFSFNKTIWAEIFRKQSIEGNIFYLNTTFWGFNKPKLISQISSTNVIMHDLLTYSIVLEIDCLKTPQVCHSNATCEYTNGSNMCQCTAGYTGDGKDNCTGALNMYSSS